MVSNVYHAKVCIIYQTHQFLTLKVISTLAMQIDAIMLPLLESLIKPGIFSDHRLCPPESKANL